MKKRIIKNILVIISLAFVVGCGTNNNIERQAEESVSTELNDNIDEISDNSENGIIDDENSNEDNSEEILNNENIIKVEKEISDIANANVGDIVTFGLYDYGFGAGEERVEWRVLDKEGGKALLLSKYILTSHAHDMEGDDTEYIDSDVIETNWEISEVREFMKNELFYELFSNEEQEKIILSKLENPISREYYETYCPIWDHGENEYLCDDTEDKIFLLSWKDLIKYFEMTSYEIEAIGSANIYYYDAVATYKNGGAGTWWLRSPGYFGGTALCIFEDGYAQYDFSKYKNGIRPAIWVEIPEGNDIPLVDSSLDELTTEPTIIAECDWCGKEKNCTAYKNSERTSYVCDECADMCFWCDERKATIHYTNIAGVESFVCNECFESFKN